MASITKERLPKKSSRKNKNFLEKNSRKEKRTMRKKANEAAAEVLPTGETIPTVESTLDTKAMPDMDATPDTEVTFDKETVSDIESSPDTEAMASTEDQTVTEIEDLSVDEIADAILIQKELLEKQAVSTFLAIGNLLNAAKHKLSHHGMWVDWLQNNVGMSVAYAQRHMKMAREYQGNTYPVTHLGVKKAYALLALPANEREAFANKSRDLSTKEFTAAIKEQVGEKKKKTISGKQPEEAFPLMSHNDTIATPAPAIDFDSQFEYLHLCVDSLLDYIKGLSDNPDECDDLTDKLRKLLDGALHRIVVRTGDNDVN